MGRKGKKSSGLVHQCAALQPNIVPNAEAADLTEQKKYRDCLIDADKAVIASYGKTVITLSGGALGISMTVLKDFFSKTAVSATEFLVLAWSCWTFSLFCMLFSYYSSHLALRQAIDNFDAGKDPQKSFWNSVTKLLNPLSAVIFLAGLIFFIRFVAHNPF